MDHDRIEIGSGANLLLPKIVQRTNEQDLKQVANLLEHCPTEVLPVFYLRSDAILDRIVHNAYRLELEGQSMRKAIAKKDDERPQS